MPDDHLSGSGTGTQTPRRERKRPRRRRRSRGPKQKAYAALDLGTNNCRLLIARETDQGFRVIDSYSRVVRLGQGLSKTGRLADSNMDAAVEAIGICAQKIKAKSVKRWRCVATQACRQAENGEAFMRRVNAETGLSLEIISPRVESRLAVMGCINLIDTRKDVVLVVDIGGGSTELSWVDVRQLRESGKLARVHRPPISAWASIPLGVVTLSELVAERDDLGARYVEMKERVKEEIEKANSTHRFSKTFRAGKGHIIGTSGTITSLAGIHQKLPFYQRDKIDGIWMPAADAVAVARDMASRSVESRATEPCIGEDRARLLVAGCAITDVICELWPSERIRVADRGLREGILMGLIGQSQVINGGKRANGEAHV